MSVNKRLANGTLLPIAGLGTYDNNALLQYVTLPTASSDNEGLIVQYSGIDSTNYTIGGIYQCQEDSGTYSWVLLSQKPIGAVTFIGTTVQWNNLSTDDKAQYQMVVLTDD